MDRSQRMHNIKAQAMSVFPARGLPDTSTKCLVDSDTADCRDFWFVDIGQAQVAVCNRHHLSHVCCYEKAYCGRCNPETGVCPITSFPNLRRFHQAAETTTVEEQDTAAILRDYAMAAAIMTRIDVAESRLCGSHCQNWWPHPSGEAFVCKVHHQIHFCSDRHPICSFLTNDADDIDLSACPVSGRIGRIAPVFHNGKKTHARRPRRFKPAASNAAIPLSPEWVNQCVSTVMQGVDANRKAAWASVIWAILRDGKMLDTWSHQNVFNMVIGLLTNIPLQSIEINGICLIPMQAYMARDVPNKLLNNITSTVSMRTSRFTHKGRYHIITATMSSPHHVTVATNRLFESLSALPANVLVALKETLAPFFPKFTERPTCPSMIESLFV